MKYPHPIGAAENASYIDAVPAQGLEGSPVPAAAIEHPLREIVNVIEQAGLTPDGTDLTQLAQAVQAMIMARKITRNAPLTGDGTTAVPLAISTATTSAAGAVQLATAAEALAATLATKAVTPEGLAGYLPRSAITAGNGWVRFPSGHIVQWGILSAWAAGPPVKGVVTLPIAFASGADIAMCVDYNASFGGAMGRQAIWCSQEGNNTTQVVFEGSTTSLSGTVWLAIGK